MCFQRQILVYAKREIHKIRDVYHSPNKTLFTPSRLQTIDRLLFKEMLNEFKFDRFAGN